MLTTFQELTKLFKLKDKSHRQLKLGLKNKVKIVDDKKVSIRDEELKKIVKEFRNSGVYTESQVCRLYDIPKWKLHILEREQIISNFQLVQGAGSRRFFRK